MADENNKEQITAAQLQIERLMKLKLEKDKKEKIRMANAGSNEEVSVSRDREEEPVKQRPAAKETAKPRLKKKAANTIKVEKRLYEKLHKLVNALNITGGPKITKARFVNVVLKEFLSLGLDYSLVANKDEIKKIFERMKKAD